MTETVLVLGSGAREDCLGWKLTQSKKVKQVFVAPGNGGTGAWPNINNLDLDVKDNEAVLKWCKENKPSLIIIGPEDPLNRGIVDLLTSEGFTCFGPTKEAAAIECSKAFAKNFMDRHGIPTGRYKTFTDPEEAKSYIRKAVHKALVVKASGLAAGKGVTIAKSVEEACATIDQMLIERIFSDAGSTVIVEEVLEGPEVSVLAFVDGENVAVMPPSQDHKRAYDNDTGPNTGGMGAYCPCPFVGPNLLEEIEKTIIRKTVDGMAAEGKPFKGTLYAGLMLTEDGPKVLEFNCRFGDPETQAILPLLASDLYDICLACTRGNLKNTEVKWRNDAITCGVVIASGGYPASSTKGVPIKGLDDVERAGLLTFHAGTAIKDGQLVTNGGRVLTVVALSKDLFSAANKAQAGAKLVKIDKSFFRKDIAIKAIQSYHLKSLDYKTSGVDIAAGDRLVENIKKYAKDTNRSGILGTLGGFGALFDLKNAGYVEPILVSGTDGVGTKLKIALECKIYDTVGIDLVAMCVNDILVQGAEPLFFLDYFACGRLDVDIASNVVCGISKGCQQANCALIGGETAEMPGMYQTDDFDMAGFAVGAVNRNCILPRLQEIEDGDVVIGIGSSGVHSNGFSLIRKLMKIEGVTVHDRTPFDPHYTFGEILLTPTSIYIKSILPIIRMNYILALAHITGGGILGNIPRIMPKHLAVELDASCWKIPKIFQWIQTEGNVAENEMLKTFNCGLGMICIVKKQNANHVLNAMKINGESNASIVGRVFRRGIDKPVIVKNFSSSLTTARRRSNTLSMVKQKVAVLISGSGTNLQALIDYTLDKTKKSSGKIVLVISNIEGVEGLKRAQKVGIPTQVISHKGMKRLDFDKLVHKELVKANVNYVCLAGFMRILSEEFVEQWKGKMINIHPSLLPAFPGLNTHRAALKAGVRVHGSTVHFVDSGLDSGRIILQQSVPVLLNDDEQSLQERVKTVEHKIYPQALEYLVSGKIFYRNDKIIWNL